MTEPLFPDATRAAGLARLTAFLPNAGRAYANRRNTDFGPGARDNVSVLSPFIRHRLVTEDEVVQRVLARHSPQAAEKFIQEVFWRTYFKGHLETRPALWTHYRAARDQQLAAVAEGGGFAKAYRQATTGRTGIDCFDAWVEELVETGYLHNHTRMWFASIWIFTLRLPWELGADFTYRHFIDGDPASNTLSWRWVGGLHTKGKTYLARRDNIREHTAGRFDPTGLAREAPALTEPDPPAAGRLGAMPERMPDGRVGLLLTEEDLSPESLDQGGGEIAAIAGAHAVEERSPEGVSDPVRIFSEKALADGLQRAAQHFGAPAAPLPSLSALTLGDFARDHGLDTIVVPHAPVGPAAEALAAMAGPLSARGVQLVAIRRPLDTFAWPHATRGFFALKERIPELIGKLGLGAPETASLFPEG
jgi:deoxyribodipyrimidine photo-lyase